jgi:hypothetical protein
MQEAGVVNAGSPGGYIESSTGYTGYKASYDVNTAVGAATLGVYVRLQAGWTTNSVVDVGFPYVQSYELNWFSIGTGEFREPDTIKCSSSSSSSSISSVLASPGDHEVALVANPALGVWSTYICTLDVASLTLSAYVDGSLVGTTSISASTLPSSTTALSSQQGYLSLYPVRDARLDIGSAYFFDFAKNAREVSDLHDLMTLAGALSS